MTTGAFNTTPFSAAVGLWLEHDGRRIDLGNVGTDECVLRQPCRRGIAPGSKAVVCVSVDGRVGRHNVVLPDGLALGERTVRYKAVDDE